ncbi:hypothetical protein GCM10027075_21040 [Streptomyces heilongjiangensis]
MPSSWGKAHRTAAGGRYGRTSGPGTGRPEPGRWDRDSGAGMPDAPDDLTPTTSPPTAGPLPSPAADVPKGARNVSGRPSGERFTGQRPTLIPFVFAALVFS